MLYNKRCDAKVKTKVDAFSIASIIAWLEKQPAARRYSWTEESTSCRGGCLIHQYLKSHGLDPSAYYQKIACLETNGHYRFFDGDVAMERPFTFGAALKRARAVAR